MSDVWDNYECEGQISMFKEVSVSELAMALRCSARPRQEGDSCVDCPYRCLEEVDPEFLPAPPDTEIDGIQYWESCDVDKMAMDAAEMLEKLNELQMK